MSIKKDIFAPLALGLGATRRAAMLLLVMMLTTATAWAWSGNSFIMPRSNVMESANFAEVSYNGACGNCVYYAYDSSTKTLTISGSGKMTDYNDVSERPWDSYASDIQTVVIGVEVWSISNNAFQNCSNLATVFVYSQQCSLRGNGEWADDTFSNCDKLEKIYVWETMYIDYQFKDPYQYNITELPNPHGKCGKPELRWVLTGESPNYTLTICGFAEMEDYNDSERPWNSYAKDIRTIAIVDGVESIDDYAFQGCSNLATVSFAPCSALKTIGDGAFQGCSNLTSINIPVGVESIGNSAFQNCSNLTSITIPASVTSIGSSAFDGCSKLATVTVYAPSCSLDGNAFANCGSLTNIYVFGNKVASYQAAENWSAYAGKITAIPTVNTSYVDAVGTLHEGVEAVPLNNTMTQLPAGTYVVNSDVNVIDRIECMGDVNIILADGKTMTVNSPNDCINNHDYALTIYGQVLGTGTLNVAGDFNGIESNSGPITISGGTVTVTAAYNENVGIMSVSGPITISGGTVTATGNGWGILSQKGPITISGGTVTATGNNGGISSYSGTITLGLSNATDYIKASSYYFDESGTLEISGTLCDEDGNIYSGTLSSDKKNAIGGKTLRPAVILADDASNATAISEWNGGVAHVTLDGRTLYKDGAWNTLTLPFNVTIAGSVLDGTGVEARTLTEASIEGTTLNLTFGDAVTTLTAGVPYIIKWTKDDENPTIDNPVFSGVTIDATDRSFDNGVNGDERVRFIGTYNSTTFTEEDRSILFLGAENALYYPQPDIDTENPANSKYPTIGAQRAYFKIGEDDAPQQARRLTAFNIDFGEGEAQGIMTTDYTDYTDKAGAWYDLQGRRVSESGIRNSGLRHGIYIKDGRKVVVP